MSVVVDASMALRWLFPAELDSPEKRGLSEKTLELIREGEMVVPELWGLEIANTIALAGRKGGAVPKDDEQRYFAFLEALPIRVESHPPKLAFGEILSLAKKHLLSAYDATYLELSLRLRLPLSSLDGPLRSAVGREGGRLVDDEAP